MRDGTGSDPRRGAQRREGEPAPASYDTRSPFRPERADPLVVRALPIARDLPGYRRSAAFRDVLGGATVGVLSIPSAMAYAEVAGVPLVNGLYTLLLPMLVYALLGSSRQLVVGAEGTAAVLVGAAVLPLATAGSAHAAELASLLTLLVAACYALARLARLGFLADYFSRPVLIGYLHGVAVVIVLGQVGKLVGIPAGAQQPLAKLGEVVRHADQVSGATAVVGLGALAVLLALRFFVPRVPGPLLVVIAAIPISWALDLASRGVAVVGPVPSGLPRPWLPHASLSVTASLVPAAVAIFVVTFADEILTARSFAGRRGQHVRAGQELVAMSAADLASSLTHGFTVGASPSRTAVNDTLGARTQLSGAAAAGVIALVLLFVTGPLQYLPTPVLAAVLVSVAIGLVDLDAWRSLGQIDRVELAIAAVTCGAVVLVGVLEALVTAVALSIVDTVRRSARPADAVLGWVERLGRFADVSLHPSAVTTPGIVIYRLDDRLFFGNAGYMRARVLEAVRGAPEQVRFVVFDAEWVGHTDSTGLEALDQLVDQLERGGVNLCVARLRHRLVERFEAFGLVDRIGPDEFYPSVRAALDGCLARMRAVAQSDGS